MLKRGVRIGYDDPEEIQKMLRYGDYWSSWEVTSSDLKKEAY